MRQRIYLIALFCCLWGGFVHATVENQSLMKRMLNDPNFTGDVESVRYQRAQDRMHRLQWLANPKNLLRPGLDYEDADID